MTIDLNDTLALEITTAGITKNDQPPISGTGEPGATVTLTTGQGVVLGSTKVGGDNNWTITPGSVLPEGVVTLAASQVDAAGNESPEVSGLIRTDYTAPQAPGVQIANTFQTSDKTPTILGIGEAGATLTVLQDKTGDGNFESTLGTTTVDGNGQWAITLPALNEGAPNSLAFQQEDEVGFVSPNTERAITIDATGVVSPPLFNEAAFSQPQGTSQPTISGTGDVGIRVVLEGDHDGDPLTAETVLGETLVAAGGAWSITPDQPLPDGTISLTAYQISLDINGDPIESTKSVTVTSQVVVDTTPPAPLTSDFSNDQSNPSAVTGIATFEGFASEPGENIDIAVAGVTFSTTSSDEAVSAMTVAYPEDGLPVVFPLTTNDLTPTIRGLANVPRRCRVGGCCRR